MTFEHECIPSRWQHAELPECGAHYEKVCTDCGKVLVDGCLSPTGCAIHLGMEPVFRQRENDSIHSNSKSGSTEVEKN